MGASVVEVLLVLAVVAVLLGLGLWSIRQGPDRTRTRGGAEVVASFLERAGAQARAGSSPVAVALAPHPAPTALYLLAGDEAARLVGKLDLSRDFPGVVLNAGLAGEQLAGNLGLGQANVDLEAWSAEYSDFKLIVFHPSGEVSSRGIGVQDESAFLLLSAGIEVGAEPHFSPTRVAYPQTLSVTSLGLVQLQAGVFGPLGSPEVVLGALPAPTEYGAQPLTLPTQEPPVLSGIRILPDPSALELEPGVDALVEPGGYLTLIAEARSPSHRPLFCQWTDEQGGRLSSTETDRMTYHPEIGAWVSRWHWRPSDADAERYLVTCRVTDQLGQQAVEEVAATLTFQASNAQQRMIYATENRFGAAATLLSIYRDGTGERQLAETPPGAFDGLGSWSPDGSRALISSNRSGRQELYMVNADGSDFRALTNLVGGKGSPEFSPMGTRVAFIYPTDQGSGVRDLWVINADGSELRNLTNSPGVDEQVFALQGDGYLSSTWSPNEAHLAYGRNQEIWVVDSDGSNESRRISGNLPSCITPSWSPDGQWLYFISGNELYRYSVNGFDWPDDGAEVIPTSAPVARSVQLSPDGERLVFMSTAGVQLLELASGSVQQITNGDDSCPAWVNDDLVSYVRRGGGQQFVQTVRLSNGKVEQVTDPGGDRIFFLGWSRDLSDEP